MVYGHAKNCYAPYHVNKPDSFFLVHFCHLPLSDRIELCAGDWGRFLDPGDGVQKPFGVSQFSFNSHDLFQKLGLDKDRQVFDPVFNLAAGV